MQNASVPASSPLSEEGKVLSWYSPGCFNITMPFANTVKTTPRGHLPSRISLGLLSSVVSPCGVSYVAFRDLMSCTQTRRGHWPMGHQYPEGEGFGDLGACLSPSALVLHPEKEPGTSAVTYRCSRDGHLSLGSFPGPRPPCLTACIFSR